MGHMRKEKVWRLHQFQGLQPDPWCCSLVEGRTEGLSGPTMALRSWRLLVMEEAVRDGRSVHFSFYL